jgi:hypothetical protein
MSGETRGNKIGDVFVDISANNKPLADGLNTAHSMIEKAGAGLEKAGLSTGLSGISGKLSNFAGAAMGLGAPLALAGAAIGGLVAVVGGFGDALEAAARKESDIKKLGRAIGDLGQGAAMFDRLEHTAAATAFAVLAAGCLVGRRVGWRCGCWWVWAVAGAG